MVQCPLEILNLAQLLCSPVCGFFKKYTSPQYVWKGDGGLLHWLLEGTWIQWVRCLSLIRVQQNVTWSRDVNTHCPLPTSQSGCLSCILSWSPDCTTSSSLGISTCWLTGTSGSTPFPWNNFAFLSVFPVIRKVLSVLPKPKPLIAYLPYPLLFTKWGANTIILPLNYLWDPLSSWLGSSAPAVLPAFPPTSIPPHLLTPHLPPRNWWSVHL